MARHRAAQVTANHGRIRAGGRGRPDHEFQTMTNTPTEDAGATIDQIRRCEDSGADIIRVSCARPPRSTAALKDIVQGGARCRSSRTSISTTSARSKRQMQERRACASIPATLARKNECAKSLPLHACEERLRNPHRSQCRKSREGPARKIWRAVPGSPGRKCARPHPDPRGPWLPS